MSVTVKQIGMSVYLVGGESFRQLREAIRHAKIEARKLEDFIGVPCNVALQVWD